MPTMAGYVFDESCQPIAVVPDPPSLEPTSGSPGDGLVIRDDAGRIQDGDIAFFFQSGAPTELWTPVVLNVAGDGRSATFDVPNRPIGVYQISVRPDILADPRFEDFVFTIQ